MKLVRVYWNKKSELKNGNPGGTVSAEQQENWCALCLLLPCPVFKSWKISSDGCILIVSTCTIDDVDYSSYVYQCSSKSPYLWLHPHILSTCLDFLYVRHTSTFSWNPLVPADAGTLYIKIFCKYDTDRTLAFALYYNPGLKCLSISGKMPVKIGSDWYLCNFVIIIMSVICACMTWILHIQFQSFFFLRPSIWLVTQGDIIWQ